MITLNSMLISNNDHFFENLNKEEIRIAYVNALQNIRLNPDVSPMLKSYMKLQTQEAYQRAKDLYVYSEPIMNLNKIPLLGEMSNYWIDQYLKQDVEESIHPLNQLDDNYQTFNKLICKSRYDFEVDRMNLMQLVFDEYMDKRYQIFELQLN